MTPFGKMILALGAAVALALPAVGANGAEPILVRQNVAINATVVRLGDLFENAGEKGMVPVAYAPQPGKRAVYDAAWLGRLAKRHGLAWQPATYQEYAVVERESVVIRREEIEDKILAALLDRGADKDIRVELSNPMLRLHVPGGADTTVAVEDIAFDPRTRRFDAVLLAPAEGPFAQRTRVAGRTYKSISVPVLKRPFSNGEIIGRDDIETVSLRSEQVQPGIAVDAESVIGKAAKRGLRAGQPVFVRDVMRPVLVNKGGLVTITLLKGRMSLTAQGKADESGGLGDTVRVINTQTKQVIEAVVVGPGRTAVGPQAAKFAQAVAAGSATN